MDFGPTVNYPKLALVDELQLELAPIQSREEVLNVAGQNKRRRNRHFENVMNEVENQDYDAPDKEI